MELAERKEIEKNDEGRRKGQRRETHQRERKRLMIDGLCMLTFAACVVCLCLCLHAYDQRIEAADDDGLAASL